VEPYSIRIVLLTNRPVKCPLESFAEYCFGEEFMAHEMVKHWREFHEMKDVTKALNSTDRVHKYRHRLTFSATGNMRNGKQFGASIFASLEALVY
jgi:hypothetical protein